MTKARVLTRSELAEHLGVDKQMVTKWERSGMPVHTRGRGVASQWYCQIELVTDRMVQ